MNGLMNLTIKAKLILLVLVTLVGMSFITIYDSITEKQIMMDAKKERVETIITGISSQIHALQNQVKEGKLTMEAAQKEAKDIVSSFRYDGNNYVWINDFHPNMIMHPLKPSLDGSDLSEYKDKKGNLLFVNMAKTAEKSGQGYVEYFWTKPNQTVPVPKMSFVKEIPGWNWILGTGIYIDDVNEAFYATLISHFAILAFLIAISIGVAYWVFNAINRPLKEMSSIMQRVSNDGDLSQTISIRGNDEIGRISADFNHHIQFLANTIEEIQSVMANVARGNTDVSIHTEMKGVFDVQTINGLEGRFKHILENTESVVNSLKLSFEEINLVMSEMSTGKFDRRISIDVKGEFEKLEHNINQSLDSVEEAITHISEALSRQASGNYDPKSDIQLTGDLKRLDSALHTTCDKVGTTILQINHSAESVSRMSEELAQSAMAFSEKTQNQAATLEETSASTEEITATVRQNTDSARNANALARQAQEKAHKGAQINEVAVQSMDQITESSNQIADIITLIDSIAFQTNLLALNAAVEAARAGEHGRGFAVVAGEVRNLAQKSADAARQIKTLIEDSVQKIHEGADYVNQSKESLSEINEVITKVTSIISEITTSSEEQAKAVEHINQAIVSLDKDTQQNALIVEQTAQNAQQMKEAAYQMSRQVDFFKVSGDSMTRLNDETDADNKID
ncbi:MAG: methyl-accepting chemotaxis protein [Hydrogenovibrio sp.]